MSVAGRGRSNDPDLLKTSYWGVVEDCLVQFHRLPKGSAHGRTNALRKKLEVGPDGMDADTIYHDEPFYVACDIAGMHDIRAQEELLALVMTEYRLVKHKRDC